MNKKLNLFLAGVLGLLLAVIPAQAQTALTTTTLSEAVDDSETTIDIASATGVLVGDIVFLDREAMRVLTVDTTNNRITVQRGVAGTSASAHANSSVIWHEAPAGLTGSSRAGSCAEGS